MGESSKAAQMQQQLQGEYQPEEGSQYNKLRNFIYDPKSKFSTNDITIGCEFDFILAASGVPGARLDPLHGQRVVRQALSQPLEVNCTIPECKHDFQLPLGKEENEYSTWKVTADPSLRDPSQEEDPNIEYYPIEVTSRKLGLRALILPGGHELSYQEEIIAVLDKLNNTFHISKHKKHQPGYHPLITHKCGFHVHVGAGDRVLPFATVRRVFATFIACERQIDGLHTSNRITGTKLGSLPISLSRDIAPRDPTVLTNPITHNKPLSHYLIEGTCKRRQEFHRESTDEYLDSTEVFSTFPGNLGEDRGEASDLYRLEVHAWLKYAFRAENARQLRELSRMADKLCTINLRNLPNPGTQSPEWAAKKMTIEFRQHLGTLEPLTALCFIDVVVKLVSWCNWVSDDEFKALVGVGGDPTHPRRRRLRDPQFETEDFCKLIGCGEVTLGHYFHPHLSGCDVFHTYLQDLQDDAFEAAKRGIRLAEDVLGQVRFLRAVTNEVAVKEQIKTKLLAGGYGQFDFNSLRIWLRDHGGQEEFDRLMLGRESQIVL